MTLLTLKPILFHLILAGGGIIIFGAGVIGKTRSKNLLFFISTGTVIAAALVELLINKDSAQFLMMLDTGDYARFFNVMFALLTFLSLLFTHQYEGLRKAGDEFYGLMIFALLGMSLVAGAVNWIIFFLGFEILSLSFYVLIAIRRDDPYGNEAALKYIIMGMIAGGFLAFGIAMIYASTGSLDMAVSLTGLEKSWDSPVMLLSLCLILAAVGFKISMVPFHLWTPDVYQGAPTPVTALLTTGSKIAVFAGFIRIMMHASDWLWGFSLPILWAVAAATMLTGSITALSQTSIKRLLAYSSIAQMGYVLMGMAAIKNDAGEAVIFYLVVYAITDIGAFGTIATLCTKTGKTLDDLNDFKGLGYSHPWQAALLTLCILSLAGLPPTAGFIGKFIVFRAVLEVQHTGLAILGIAAALLSIFAYLKVIIAIFMKSADKIIVTSGLGTAAMTAFTVIFVALLLFGICPSTIVALIGTINP